jgi:hypothetical protein
MSQTNGPIVCPPIQIDSPSNDLIIEAQSLALWKLDVDNQISSKQLRKYTIHIQAVRRMQYRLPTDLDALGLWWNEYLDTKQVILQSLPKAFRLAVANAIGEDEEIPIDLGTLINEIARAIKAVAVSPSIPEENWGRCWERGGAHLGYLGAKLKMGKGKKG